MRKLVILGIFLISLRFSLFAIDVRGEIVNIENKEKVMYASVGLYSADSVLIMGTQSDEKGQFTLPKLSKGNYYLKISHIEYLENITVIDHLEKDIDLGILYVEPVSHALGEVTVQAKRVVQKANRRIVIPTLEQVRLSDNGMDILFNANIRGLKIDPVQQTISKSGGENVQIRVNGRKIDMAELVAIRPSEVLRIDYYDEPSIRYANDQDASGIVDIILKQKQTGGFVAFDANHAVTTGFANDQLTARINHKKSEFSFLYKLSYRSYKKRRIDQERIYNYPDHSLIRYQTGLNAPFKYAYHTFKVNYNYKNKKGFYLNATILDDVRNRKEQEANNVRVDQLSLLSNSHENYKTDLHSPALDLYLQNKFQTGHELCFNLVGAYINSDVKRNYVYQNTDTLTRIDEYIKGDRYSLIGELVYTIPFSHSNLEMGLKYNGSRTDNRYYQPGLTKALMNHNDFYAFAEWSGSLRKLNYSLGIAGSRIWFKEGDSETTHYIVQPLVRLGYSLLDNLNFHYVFRIQPTTPSLGDLNDAVRLVDEYSIRKGNAGLKPYKTYYNSFNINYDNDFISTGVTAKYEIRNRPIMEEVEYDQGADRFVYTIDNQKKFKEFNIQAEGMWTLPWKVGYLSTIVGFSNYVSEGNKYRHSLNDFYWMAQLQLQYKRFSLSIASMLSRFEELYGESLDWDEKNTQIILKYKHNAFSAAIGILNPLGSNSWKTSSQNLSQKLNVVSRTYLNDNTNMVFVNLSYNFSFGRKYTYKSKKLENRDIDTGIMEIK